jgi:hypothetical protein
MEQRISILMLGVADLERSRKVKASLELPSRTMPGVVTKSI